MTKPLKTKPLIDDWREIIMEDFRRDPKEAEVYLKLALQEYEEDGDTEALLLALRTVAEAQGGVGTLAKKTDLTRQSLYKALSPRGNPRLSTIGMILKALGYRLSIKPLRGAHV